MHEGGLVNDWQFLREDTGSTRPASKKCVGFWTFDGSSIVHDHSEIQALKRYNFKLK